jgi:hypothetical protein
VQPAFVAVPAEGTGEHREGTRQPVALRQRHLPAGESLLGKTGVGRKHSMIALWVASIASVTSRGPTSDGRCRVAVRI